LKDTLEKAGVRVETTKKGRYKVGARAVHAQHAAASIDREQSEALVNAIDEAMARAISEGRRVPEPEARAMMDAAPLIGPHAKARGLLDGLARDEDLALETGDKRNTSPWARRLPRAAPPHSDQPAKEEEGRRGRSLPGRPGDRSRDRAVHLDHADLFLFRRLIGVRRRSAR